MTRRSFFIAAAAIVAAQVVGCAAAEAQCLDPKCMGVFTIVMEPAFLANNYTTAGSGGYAGWVSPYTRYRIQGELVSHLEDHPWMQNRSMKSHVRPRLAPPFAGRVSPRPTYPRLQNRSMVSQFRGFHGGRR